MIKKLLYGTFIHWGIAGIVSSTALHYLNFSNNTVLMNSLVFIGLAVISVVYSVAKSK